MPLPRKKRYDDPKSLKDLGTFLDPEELPVDDPGSAADDITHCNNHFHRDWYRGGLDGSRVKLGKTCLIPDGHGGIWEKNVPLRKIATRKVGYEPGTGRTHKEEY